MSKIAEARKITRAKITTFTGSSTGYGAAAASELHLYCERDQYRGVIFSGFPMFI